MIITPTEIIVILHFSTTHHHVFINMEVTFSLLCNFVRHCKNGDSWHVTVHWIDLHWQARKQVQNQTLLSDITWNEEERNLCVPHQASDWSCMTTQHIDTRILCVVPYTNSTAQTHSLSYKWQIVILYLHQQLKNNGLL